jgi:ribosomal-protein-alanine N-acetyltransferase
LTERAVCPTLHGVRLTLEPLTAGHALALFPLLADSELWLYADDRQPESVEALRERYRRWETRRSPDGRQLWLNWAVMVTGDGIGGFVQATVPIGTGTAEIAYVIAKRFWSLGLGTEAVRVMLAFLQCTLRVETVTATVDDRNAASLRLLQKLRFNVVDSADTRNLKLKSTLETP